MPLNRGERMKRKSVGIILAVSLTAVIGFLIYSHFSGNFEYDFFAMDTYNSLKISGFGSAGIADEIESLVYDLDVNILSRQSESSALSALNRNHGGPLGDDLRGYLDTLLDVYSKSGGRFDFTLGTVSDLWGFGKEGKVPDTGELNEALSLTGADKIKIKDGELTIPEGAVIDFGSAGKGIGLDVIRDTILKKSRISRAVVSLGGSVLTYGKKEFRVAVNDPFESGTMAVLTLPSCCVSTSGSYERFFEQDGRRYHHILDPETGYPVDNGLVSVTVVSDSGILSDALSTACFACGLDKGMELARTYGCDALFIDSDKNVYITEGLEGKTEITKDGYILKNE